MFTQFSGTYGTMYFVHKTSPEKTLYIFFLFLVIKLMYCQRLKCQKR